MGNCQRYWPPAKCLLCAASCIIVIATSAVCQNEKPDYLVRIAHETTDGTTCVLLQTTGDFHYESGDENTKVFEGKVTPDQLNSVRRELLALASISQAKIEEPLIPGPHDVLDIHFFHQLGAKELLFRSYASQEPYRALLKPLLQWMYSLPKLPHRELTEDAGKQNCLPRTKIRLKTRDEVAPEPPLTRTPVAGRRIIPAPHAITPVPVQPLARLELLQKSSSLVQQRCALIANDGRYRFEYRSQKVGKKKVENRLARGQLAPAELNTLRDLLNSPTLARIRHHEPPGGMPLNIMGSVLELSINRGAKFQDLILTDATHRNTFYFSGDADLSTASPLLKFLREKIESQTAVVGGAEENGCSSAD
jgi:hypothetical protein